MRSKKLLVLIIGLMTTFALVAAACGNDDDGDTAADTGGQTDSGSGDSGGDTGDGGSGDTGGDSGDDISGSVVISGSSTVEPISVRVAELFEDVQPDVSVTVDGPGTGDGFKLFCEGETDISDASRQIKDSEAENCAANGIEFVELRVAIDGIAVMTGEGNPVECVSFNDIYGLVGPESTGFGSWSDAGSLGLETNPAFPMPTWTSTVPARSRARSTASSRSCWRTSPMSGAKTPPLVPITTPMPMTT